MIPGSDSEHPTFIRSFGYALQGFAADVANGRKSKV